MNTIALANIPALPAFAPELSPAAIAEKENALASSALIGKVANQQQNDTAINVMKQLKFLSNSIERERKRLTEPFIEAQRSIKRTADTHIDELDREAGRIEMLVKDFALAEQRRIRDEQEAQRKELERIERERQAEIMRIAREQALKEAELARAAAEAAAKEREAQIMAERKLAEAKGKEARAKAEAERVAQIERAEAARIERERQAAELAKASEARAAAAIEKAQEASRIESRTIEVQRTIGQTNRKVWNIKQIDSFVLVKARPDLVRKIEWDMVRIKELLNAGEKLPGVQAEEDLAVGVRGRAQRALIDV